MIQLDSLSAEWLKSVSSRLGKVDSSLLEKAVRALFLTEQLKVNNLTFVFKGGTSLLLHLEKPLRFSIDVDIITSDDRTKLIKAMDAVIEAGAFTRWEPDERTLRKDLPVKHYRSEASSSSDSNHSPSSKIFLNSFTALISSQSSLCGKLNMVLGTKSKTKKRTEGYATNRVQS